MSQSGVAPSLEPVVGEPSPPPIRVFSAEVIEERVVVVDERSWPRRIVDAIASAYEWLFGIVSLWVGLAFLATFPVLQFLSLGYLLEVSGRVSRTGRFRDGFVGVRTAARLGSGVLGTWLVLWPLRLVSDLWYSSKLISPYAGGTKAWRFALIVLSLMVLLHLAWAWFRGARLRHFLWPAPIKLFRRIRQGGMYAEARDAVWEFTHKLRLPYYFWLGCRGFAGAIAWLFAPVMMLVAAFYLPTGLAVLSGLAGSFFLAWVAVYLPFLHAQFAAENRFVAMFDVGRARQTFNRAPISHWLALLVVLLFALPLYLLKIEFLEREVAWLPALVFVAFIAPARLLTGWAVGRGRHKPKSSPILLHLLMRGGMLPVLAIYLLIVYLSRYTSWYGSWSLFEQHAFLLPVPFLGL